MYEGIYVRILKMNLIVWLCLVCVHLLGCATVQSDAFFHGIGYCNAGLKDITYLKIQYGNIERPVGQPLSNFTGGLDRQCNNGADYVTMMPIPENVKVEWQTINGPRHKVTVPIRSLIKSANPVSRIRIKLIDEKLQILQISFDDRQQINSRSVVIFEN